MPGVAGEIGRVAVEFADDGLAVVGDVVATADVAPFRIGLLVVERQGFDLAGCDVDAVGHGVGH